MAFPAVLADFAPTLRRGGLHLSTFCQLPDPNAIEALAKTKLDSFIFDMQHGMFDEAAVLAGVAAASLEGKPAFVRLPVDAGGLASRVLDFGAAGVVCPMVNTVADAERLVSYIKFPPIGARSWGPRRAIPLSGLSAPGYLARANELTLAIAMIETRQALDNLDAILAVPGVDGVFVGPSDLSVSLSGGATLDSAEVASALDHIAARARTAGKIAGIFAINPAYAVDCATRGYSFIALMQDAMFMQQAADGAVAAVREKAA
ncbi:HpcH/HpaI aldolase family protein [Kumtagia ephedrae]|uniref:Hydroxyacid aldolase n=1 Tax=Kumtagia ephedrae TaxID=2116701 RepID=A0A2P7RTR6_9HYPH|nr:aldolase/citrate lyase family protein [Mesorhizobium ephedrae]PSJ53598.1 hydroxyacid aldolase [Mesorhizobium ephedrae]